MNHSNSVQNKKNRYLIQFSLALNRKHSMVSNDYLVEYRFTLPSTTPSTANLLMIGLFRVHLSVFAIVRASSLLIVLSLRQLTDFLRPLSLLESLRLWLSVVVLGIVRRVDLREWQSWSDTECIKRSACDCLTWTQ